jgi:hypothetical protein
MSSSLSSSSSPGSGGPGGGPAGKGISSSESRNRCYQRMSNTRQHVKPHPGPSHHRSISRPASALSSWQKCINTERGIIQNQLTSLHVRHSRRRNAKGVHDKIIINAPFRMPGKPILFEHISLPLHRLLLRLFVFIFVIPSASPEYEFALLWMFLYVFFFLLVYLFKFPLQFR